MSQSVAKGGEKCHRGFVGVSKSVTVKLSVGLAAGVLVCYALFAEKNGGFDEGTGLGRASEFFSPLLQRAIAAPNALPLTGQTKPQAMTNEQRSHSRRLAAEASTYWSTLPTWRSRTKGTQSSLKRLEWHMRRNSAASGCM